MSSVLSSPQGTPERVWSLVAGLIALGGECDRPTFEALLNPGYVKDGVLVRAKDTLAGDALGAASSLGLVKAGPDKAVLTSGLNLGDAMAFADYVHDRLSSLKSGETEILASRSQLSLPVMPRGDTTRAWFRAVLDDEVASETSSKLM